MFDFHYNGKKRGLHNEMWNHEQKKQLDNIKKIE